MIAYAFLTRSPNDDLIEFANELYNKHKCDIYIIIDDDNYLIKRYNPNINFIKINKNNCISNNLIYSIEPHLGEILNKSQNKMVTSWDKAIYYFNYENTKYDHIWLIEDDVFIASIDSLAKINNDYPDSDLLTAKNNEFKDHEVRDWFWPYCLQVFQKPCFCSMMCACRVSKKLLSLIVQKSKEISFTPYHEFLFNTIAGQANLKVDCPNELKTIVYRNEWSFEEIKENPLNLYHPLKNFSLHKSYRERLINSDVNIISIDDCTNAN